MTGRVSERRTTTAHTTTGDPAADKIKRCTRRTLGAILRERLSDVQHRYSARPASYDFAVLQQRMDNVSVSSGSSSADGDELSAVLNRRQKINEALEDGKPVPPQFNRRPSTKNVYLEFKEFSRKQINEYEATFKKFDTGKDGYLDLGELKRMMEKLGVPQTHLALKAMIKEVDEDYDDKISFREFLLIYRKAYDGSLPLDCGLNELARLTEINVDEVGVIGAKEFFEAKIEYQGIANRFEYELRQEIEEKKRSEDEMSKRKIAFKEKTAIFQ